MNDRMWWEWWAEQPLPSGQNPAMPQTNRERQEALRARRAMLGLTEVRGAYLPPELHARLKADAKKMLKAWQKGQAKE